MGRAFPKRQPGEGPEKIPTWTHEKVPNGTWFTGWLSGYAEWVDVHRTPVSKPCHDLMTGGRKTCPYCARRMARIDRIGYVPLRADGGRPVVVIVPDYHEDVLRKIRLHDPVKVSRAATRGSPIVVAPSKHDGPWKPNSPFAAQPVDITAWLLLLWGEAELSVWLKAHAGEVEPREVEPREVEPREVDDEPGPRDPMLKAAWDRAKRESKRAHAGVTSISDVIDAAYNPATNGIHKPR